jgi:hypothetical protein
MLSGWQDDEEKNMRFDWFIADNGEDAHTGVMDTSFDAVFATFNGVEDGGSRAEALAGLLNQASVPNL